MVISLNKNAAIAYAPAQQSAQSAQNTIAIIGGGFSGVMVAVHLLKNATFPLTIKLIESRPTLGQGVAYSTDSDCHLLNVPVGKMSAFVDRPEHFLDWLQSHEDLKFEAKANTFVPRKLYGQYIQAILAQAIANADPQVNLECLTNEAIALKTDSAKINVYLKDRKVLAVERVVLALGNFPATNPPVPDSTFYTSDRYISCAWSSVPRLSKAGLADDRIPRSQNRLSSLASKTPIMLIGSGLTAADLVVALHQQRHQGQIHLVSRRGLLPQADKSTVAYPAFVQAEQTPQTIRALLRLVRQEINQAQALGYDWRTVINALRPDIQTLWQKLPLTEKQRFLRHVKPYWETHRHRLAPAIAEIIEQLRKSKQLLIHAGRIQAYDEDTDGVNVLIRDRCSGKSKILRVGVVINCTGSEYDYRKLKQPLILNLLASGQIRLDPLDLGLDVAFNGALINKSGKVSPNFFTLGAPQKGCLWETTAIAEIREQAKNLAQELLKTYVRV